MSTPPVADGRRCPGSALVAIRQADEQSVDVFPVEGDQDATTWPDSRTDRRGHSPRTVRQIWDQL
jgi:hypothetical protein